LRGVIAAPEPFVMRREEEGAGHRHARVQSLIFEELRALLRDDVSDPALLGVRIAAVVLSVDYRHARVHFMIRGTEGGVEPERRCAELALGHATPFFRARLAEAVELKRVPDLRFVFDGVALSDEEETPCSE
jgi:ribosome-binding factor A